MLQIYIINALMPNAIVIFLDYSINLQTNGKLPAPQQAIA